MRTLEEIIKDADAGQAVGPDEAIYAINTLLSLMAFDQKTIVALAQAEKDDKPRALFYSARWQAKERARRLSKAMAISPKRWLGESDDPMSPEVQKRKSLARKLLAKSRPAEGG